MPWILRQNEDIKLERPCRVRLDNGITRTSEEITDELLEEIGWRWEEWPEPEITNENTATTSTTYIDIIES